MYLDFEDVVHHVYALFYLDGRYILFVLQRLTCQCCCYSVIVVLQKCYRSVTEVLVLLKCYRSVTEVLQRCYRSVINLLQLTRRTNRCVYGGLWRLLRHHPLCSSHRLYNTSSPCIRLLPFVCSRLPRRAPPL